MSNRKSNDTPAKSTVRSLHSCLSQIAIALASNIGGQASPISSPQNLIGLAAMDPPLSWLQWFAISLPVATVSVVAIWSYLHIGYRWERDLSIPRMRKNTDPLTWTHWYVLFVTAVTIMLWCIEKKFEAWVGDMGVIAIIPIIAFFGPGILSKVSFPLWNEASRAEIDALHLIRVAARLSFLPVVDRVHRHVRIGTGSGRPVVWSAG